MYVIKECNGLYIGINNKNQDCSSNNLHQVVMKSFYTMTNITTLLTGTGCVGSTSYMLNTLNGLFIGTYMIFYLEDYSNVFNWTTNDLDSQTFEMDYQDLLYSLVHIELL
jgi:hypothetical protein